MKKNFFRVVFIATIALAAGWNFNQSKMKCMKTLLNIIRIFFVSFLCGQILSAQSYKEEIAQFYKDAKEGKYVTKSYKRGTGPNRGPSADAKRFKVKIDYFPFKTSVMPYVKEYVDGKWIKENNGFLGGTVCAPNQKSIFEVVVDLADSTYLKVHAIYPGMSREVHKFSIGDKYFKEIPFKQTMKNNDEVPLFLVYEDNSKDKAVEKMLTPYLKTDSLPMAFDITKKPFSLIKKCFLVSYIKEKAE